MPATPEYYVKIHRNSQEYLIAVCDKEVLGMVLERNGVKIQVNKKFYGGELVYEDELKQEISKATSINAFGVKIINLLDEMRLITKRAVIWFENNTETYQEHEKIGHVIMIRNI